MYAKIGSRYFLIGKKWFAIGTHFRKYLNPVLFPNYQMYLHQISILKDSEIRGMLITRF